MTERGLRISEVNGWELDKLGLDATSLGRLVTKLEGALQSMLIEQDDLAESWNGPGASAAADRVVNEKTAGSHICAKIDDIKDLLASGQTELQDAKNFVSAKRASIIGLGFEVDDRGIVSASEKIKQLNQAGGERADVMAAGLAVMAEAGRYTTEMLQSLQHAKGVADSVQTRLTTLNSELSTLMIQEAPSKAIRTSGLVPGLPPGTAIPADLGPLGTVQSLQEGIPVTYTSPDGNTTTITPNPDGTRTVAQSFTGPDGSTTTTTSVNGAPPTTTVTTTRPDGSGIVDSTITGPDGKTQRVQTVPKGQGKSTTYAVNPDGSLGAQLSESYPAPNGGVITDVPGPNGELDRQWVRPDGFRAFEQYVVGPDGQQHLAGTSNSAGMNSVMNPDGTIKTTFADGRTAQTGQLADGRIVTQFEDGSVLGYDPEKAVPGTPKQSTWDVVKTWTGGQWDGMYSSTVGTVDAHPVATGAGLVRVRSASGPPAPVERWPRTQQLRQVDRRNSRHAPSTCSILAHRVLGGRWSIRWTPQPMPRRGRRLPTS
ncbi:hypothetical protein IU485_18860 [Nocardia cyriacigeorgica]|uniref:hypothetical protein n=1 Tax=Nocardia cyriacigeorgica TaxID=135487 RepID=UPI001893D819|nr:hypothetical protein [Nocardia cyriacigeorgica]MBF6083428.1 hypothetical protein [Nocardia cyriacigeorgica]BDT85323.1 hypothetical protein FMUAM8_10870 [Nocardia cyriacigeorgica]